MINYLFYSALPIPEKRISAIRQPRAFPERRKPMHIQSHFDEHWASGR
jgi:hypothetical protein